MPFTPFHMGPGLAMKAVGGRHFSLTVFGFSQVTMDIEPLVRIYSGDAVLHGFTHTYLGATLIGLLSLLAGRPVCRMLLQRFKPDASLRLVSGLWGDGQIRWGPAAAGAFIGTYSHVLLDSLMHSDMQPWTPLADGNVLLFLIPVDTLHVACVSAGCLGLLLLAAFAMRSHRGTPDS